jgi:hypothetical protein
MMEWAYDDLKIDWRTLKLLPCHHHGSPTVWGLWVLGPAITRI